MNPDPTTFRERSVYGLNTCHHPGCVPGEVKLTLEPYESEAPSSFSHTIYIAISERRLIFLFGSNIVLATTPYPEFHHDTRAAKGGNRTGVGYSFFYLHVNSVVFSLPAVCGITQSFHHEVFLVHLFGVIIRIPLDRCRSEYESYSNG